MGDPAAMHELDENVAAAVMDGLCDLTPAIDLCLAVNPGNARVANAVRRRGCSLGDDETRGSTLAIIGCLQDTRRIGFCIGTRACQRRHDNTVGKVHVAEMQGFEEFHWLPPVSGCSCCIHE